MIKLKISENNYENQSSYSKILLKELTKNYNLKNFFSSISHKKGLSFVGISKNKIGIDIEIIKERNIDFFNIFSEKEYKILGGKNWENFYILWTAKESIIKYERKNLDFLKEISLKKFYKNKKIISNIKFSYKLKLKFLDKIFYIFSGKNEKTVYSICVNSKR